MGGSNWANPGMMASVPDTESPTSRYGEYRSLGLEVRLPGYRLSRPVGETRWTR